MLKQVIKYFIYNLINFPSIFKIKLIKILIYYKINYLTLKTNNF